MVEGAVLVREALDAGVELEALYVDGAVVDEPWARELADRAAAHQVRCLELEPGVLARAVDTVTPQPVAAVARVLHRPLGYFTSTVGGFVFVLAGVADPGNVGTILRSAEAAGVKGVLAGPGSVDLYNPKTVRAAAGSLFRVPVGLLDEPVEAVLVQLRDQGYATLGTVAAGGADYDQVDLTAPTVVVLGNEAHGLPVEVTAVLDGLLTIPMVGANESLNVAMAATVIAFELARQRRTR